MPLRHPLPIRTALTLSLTVLLLLMSGCGCGPKRNTQAPPPPPTMATPEPEPSVEFSPPTDSEPTPEPTPEAIPEPEPREPHVFGTLEPTDAERLQRLRETFAEVDEGEDRSWRDNFSFDAMPERELALWESIAEAYRADQESHPERTADQKREVLSVLVMRSMLSPDKAMPYLHPVAITKADAEAAMAVYVPPATVVPPSDLPSPTPSEGYQTE